MQGLFFQMETRMLHLEQHYTLIPCCRTVELRIVQSETPVTHAHALLALFCIELIITLQSCWLTCTK